MRVLVYVEGPADRAALDKLLDPIVSEGRRQGVGIRLVPLDGKSHVLNDSPRKAADHLAEHPMTGYLRSLISIPCRSTTGRPMLIGHSPSSSNSW